MILIALLLLANTLSAVHTDLDTTYGTDSTGIVTTRITDTTSSQAINAARLDGSGRLVVAGTFADSPNQVFVARYNTDGSLDTTFNGTGILVYTIIPSVTTVQNASANAVAFDGTGDIYVAGSAFLPPNIPFLAVAKVLAASGTLDLTFGLGGVNAGQSVAFTVSTDIGVIGNGMDVDSVSGNIVIAGSALVAGAQQIALGIIPSTGAPLPPILFTTPPAGTTGIAAESVVVDQASQDIYVGGYARTTAGTLNTLVGRFDSTGVLDATYGSAGTGFAQFAIGTDSRLFGITLDATPRVVAGGVSDDQLLALRVNAAGTALDWSTVTPISSYAQANAVLIQTDGKIVTSGFTIDSFLTARYLAAGTLDNAVSTGFGQDGYIETPIGSEAQSNTVAVQADGKLLAAGFTDSDMAIVRYNPNNSDVINIVQPVDGGPALPGTTTPINGNSSESFTDVTVTVNGTALSTTTTTDSNGNWDAGTSPVLLNLPSNNTVVATLATGASDSHTVTSSAADQLTITSPLNTATVTTYTEVSGTTNLAPGTTIELLVDAVLVGSDTVAADGTWGPINTGTMDNGSRALLARDVGVTVSDSITVTVKANPVSAQDYIYAYYDVGTNPTITTTYTAIPYNFAPVATTNNWAYTLGTGVFTCNQTGTYLVEYGLTVSRAAGGTNPRRVFAQVVINGGAVGPNNQTRVMREVDENLIAKNMKSACIVDVTSGDTLEIRVRAQQSAAIFTKESAGGIDPSIAAITISRVA